MRVWIINRKSDLAYLAVIIALLLSAILCNDRTARVGCPELEDRHPLYLRLLSAEGKELRTRIACDAAGKFAFCPSTELIFELEDAEAVFAAHRDDFARVSIRDNEGELFGARARITKVIWVIEGN